jgi:hypothetical protein
MNAELAVGVLEMLANRLGRDSSCQAISEFVRPSATRPSDLALAWRQPNRRAGLSTQPQRVATELPQVRDQEFEDSAVAFYNVPGSAIELQSRAPLAAAKRASCLRYRGRQASW